jgi:SpoVK/Ycf46/Vps4 family AAA+-type ATPase
LEDFEGILIATTNLADNLDPAFERRLLYKIEFLKPGIQIREKIWKSMIPDMDPQEIQILAERYTFSGGQISNIATKRDIDYAIDGKAPGYEQMLMYCETESLQKAKESKRIGFR